MEISKGKEKGAVKFMFYAPEGFGKSTFASECPEPLFIDVEGGTKQLDVRRFNEKMDWDNILNAVQYVIDNPDCCKTLVLDTVDWAEQDCINKLNKEHKTENILTLDYGKGSLYVVAEFQKLIDLLDKVIEKGINVVLLAHAQMRKFEQPEEMGAYDRWELKLQSKQVKSKVKEWADILIFGNYKTLVYTDDKTKSKKAQGGERVLYTEHHPCWDAKNRHGLKRELPFKYSEFKAIFENAPDKKEPEKKPEKKPAPDPEPVKADPEENEHIKAIKAAKIPEELKKLMIKDKVTIGELEGTVADKGLKPFEDNLEDYGDEFIKVNIVNPWDKVLKFVIKYRKQMEDNPFDKKGV